ncbi:MAG: hypothetical protein AMXMBFR58_29780 [Phycisphaerae bacterium]
MQLHGLASSASVDTARSPAKDIVIEAVNASDVKWAAVAQAIGVAYKTLDHWMNRHEHGRSPSADALLALLRPGVLSPAGRELLLSRVLAVAGMVGVRPDAVELDQSPLSTQVMQISRELGDVAGLALGAGDRSLNPEDARELLVQVDELVREVLELQQALRRAAGAEVKP